MKRFLPVIIFVILAVVSYEYGIHRTVPNPDPNHTHADFAVWINGQQLDFAQEKYMTEELTAMQLQALKNSTATGSSLQVLKQYLHLHGMNGHVIHRHKPALTFGDFLASLGFQIDPFEDNNEGGCLITDANEQICDTTTSQNQWSFYVNGARYDGLNLDPPLKNTMLTLARQYVFNDNDKLLLSYGADETEIRHQLALMTDEACMYSKTCPGRGPAPTESCISDPMIPCKAP